MYKSIVKPLADIIVAVLFLLLLSPVLVIVYIGLAIVNKGKPFFYQQRPGKNEKLFRIIKFKTMTDAREQNGMLLPDADRLTPFGKIVRKTSLDELPQLLNVIFGQMSLVGPRPLLPEYLPHYTEEQRTRHRVRPGITGLAQVRGRNQMKFSERFKNDVYYVQHQSFIFDLKILLWTLKALLFKSNTIVLGQTVDEVDDLGLSKNLDSNHFKEKP